MTSSYFTVCDEVEVMAGDGDGANASPAVEVWFPDSQWDRVTYRRYYPAPEDAKAAAKSLAESLRPLKPKGITGFYGSPRLNLEHPETVEARKKIEAAVKAWAGDNCEIDSIN
jgi:hypothetical protein